MKFFKESFYEVGERYLLVFAGLFFIICLFLASFPEIGTSAEAREAHISNIMVTTGEWLLPRRNGILPSKPPLTHWIVVIFSTILGYKEVTPFLARIPAVLMASLTLLLTGIFVARYSKEQTDALNEAGVAKGLLAMFLLSTTYGFISMSMVSLVDMTLCFFTISAVFITILNIEKPFGVIAFFICSAFATLAKGPLGIFMPTVFILLYLFLSKTKISYRYIFAGIFSYLVIVLPWYLYSTVKADKEFVGRQIVFENLKRFTGDEWITTKPWWFYLETLLSRGAPWIPLLLVLFFVSKRYKDSTLFERYKELNLKPFFFGVLAILIVFSASTGKRNTYILPLYPIIIFLAVSFINLTPKILSQLNKVKNIILVIYAVLSLIGIVVLGMFSEHLIKLPYSFFCLVVFLCFAVLSSYLISSSEKNQNEQSHGISENLRILRRQLSLYSQIFIILTVSITSAKVIHAEMKSYKEITEKLKVDIAKEKDLGPENSNEIYFVRHVRDEFFDPIFYYLKRPAKLIDPKSPVFEERSFVVIRKDWIENNKPMIADLHFIDCYQFKGEKFFGGNDKIFALFSVKNKQEKLSVAEINESLNKAEILPFDNCFVS